MHHHVADGENPITETFCASSMPVINMLKYNDRIFLLSNILHHNIVDTKKHMDMEEVVQYRRPVCLVGIL